MNELDILNKNDMSIKLEYIPEYQGWEVHIRDEQSTARSVRQVITKEEKGNHSLLLAIIDCLMIRIKNWRLMDGC